MVLQSSKLHWKATSGELWERRNTHAGSRRTGRSHLRPGGRLERAADRRRPHGPLALGTFNNCAGGPTPWGTYLTCEENFNGYFVNAGTIPPEQRRYGLTQRGAGYRWHEFDPRFDMSASRMSPTVSAGWSRSIPRDPDRGR